MAPISQTTADALGWTKALATQPLPGADSANWMTNQIIQDHGMNGGTHRVEAALTPIMNGSLQEDPRLQAMLDTNANRAANAAATRFGGGRYGSAAIGQGVGQAVADANNATMLQSNENARTRQLQAAGQLSNMYQTGVSQALQASSMQPSLNDLRFDGAQRVAGIGDYIQNRDQAEWDYPQTRLGQFGSLVQALGGMGGTATSVAPVQRASTAQRLIGGALAGASLGDKTGFGTGLGAIGGGLLGLFG
jgi:anti-sigma factor RsiW